MEHPILFSTPMVQAILDGRKSQTRRIIKPQPQENDHPEKLGKFWWKESHGWDERQLIPLCPYGQIGDILWVRETWRIVGWMDGEPFRIEFKDGKQKRDVYLDESRAEDYLIQCTRECEKAGLAPNDQGYFFADEIPTKWRPSIFMPKEACRIKLEITNIRIERVQDISEKDAKAEGVFLFPIEHEEDIDCWTDGTYKTAYEYLWNEINGWMPNAWNLNPWVWCLEFVKL